MKLVMTFCGLQSSVFIHRQTSLRKCFHFFVMGKSTMSSCCACVSCCVCRAVAGANRAVVGVVGMVAGVPIVLIVSVDVPCGESVRNMSVLLE